jgi:RimJ/RimL family protein N-acetyltransferase
MSDLYLSDIEEDDMFYLYQWFSDSEFLKYYDYYPPIPQTKDEVDKTFKNYKEKKESKVFGIKMSQDNYIIGIAGFDDIIFENNVATLFIGIGNSALRGRGYGKEAMNLLLNYGFNHMKLHRIQLNVLEFNLSAINLYEKSGFKKEGVFREFVLRDNKRYNLLLYGLLKNEWEE